MNGYLRQATASQVRTIGPFVDDTDFKTLENALTIANTDIVISANGGADTTKTSGGATAHGAGGIYTLTWDATDTAAVGELSYSVKVAGALVVFGTYVVLEEAVYDALFAASANAWSGAAGSSVGAANVTQWLGTAAATPTVAGVPEVDLTHVAGATTNVAALATNVDAILTDTAEIGTAGAGLTNINLPNQTMDIVGNITGNLSGSVGSVTGAVGSVTGAVGSVTGAVGSVTGNVGGNVVGSVASVTGNVGGNVVGSVASVTAKVTPIDIDGITFANMMKYIGATTQGKVVITLISGDDYTYDAYSVDGLSIVWTTTVNLGNRAQPTRS